MSGVWLLFMTYILTGLFLAVWTDPDDFLEFIIVGIAWLPMMVTVFVCCFVDMCICGIELLTRKKEDE